MKVSYIHKDKAKTAKLENEYYRVLGYGDFDENSKLFLLANDNLEILTFDQTALNIIDDNLSDYIRRDDLNYDKLFYLDANLNKIRSDIENYSQLGFPSLWNLSKNYSFFKENNYKISDFYKSKVLNEEYKMNLIEGFLSFTNIYIDKKFGDGHYREVYDFYKTQTITECVDEKFRTEELKIEKLDLNNYEDLLVSFISEGLYDEVEKEVKSREYCAELFKLIDCIFVNNLQSLNRVKTFYDDCFVIGYEDSFFTLNKSWWG